MFMASNLPAADSLLQLFYEQERQRHSESAEKEEDYPSDIPSARAQMGVVGHDSLQSMRPVGRHRTILQVGHSKNRQH
jgi:hypothetical protein